MNIPKIVGDSSEEKVGRLFEAWWSEEGLDSFIEFLEDYGIPVIDDRQQEGILDTEDMLMNVKDRHDKFLEGVEE